MGWMILCDGPPYTHKGQITLSDEHLRALAKALGIPEQQVSGGTRSIYIWRDKGKSSGGGSSIGIGSGSGSGKE